MWSRTGAGGSTADDDEDEDEDDDEAEDDGSGDDGNGDVAAAARGGLEGILPPPPSARAPADAVDACFDAAGAILLASEAAIKELGIHPELQPVFVLDR